MAGDLELHERCLVHPEQLPAAAESAAAVTAIGGGVTHEYGPRVVVAALPPSTEPVARASLPEVAMAAEPSALPAEVTSDLDDVGALGLAAFAMRESGAFAEAKAQRPLAGEDWDAAAADAPDFLEEPHAKAPAAVQAAAATSARLTGRVAVAIVIVEGPTAALKFSADERTKVVAEVQNGLSWLGSQSSPAGISWTYDIRIVAVDVAPGPAGETSEQKESRWRDPAMAQLGQGPGLAGVRAFVEAMRTRLGTDWAYCAFFTKYPLGHFAYASIGGPRLVMNYANDGWGPDNIDRVFAHESGHIFGAPDEYAASGCSCGGAWGQFSVPNTNCANCATGGGVACIMRSNEWAMCPYTPYHLGFPQGQRYSGVFLPGTDSHGLWLNASWPHFQTKWQEWSSQGLRLVDLEVTESGGQPRYSGVFRAGTGPYALWVNADWPSFQAKWQELSGQGLRLVDLAVAQIGGQARYSGVYRAGTGPYALWVNADWPSFQAKWQELSGQGLRLVDLEVSSAGGQLRYSGVFRAGTGAYALWANADWASFQAKWQQFTGQGLRLTDLEVRNVGNQVRYSGAFAAGSGGHALWADVDWASFQAKWRELNDQGLRLVDLSIRRTGVEVLASPLAGVAAAEPADGSGVGLASVGGDDGDPEGVGFGAQVIVEGGPSPADGDGDGAGTGAVVLDGESVHGAQSAAPGFGDVVLREGRTGEEGFGAVVMN